MTEPYYLLNRNYNYAFHNELFVRNTSVRPGFRETALDRVAQARERAEIAEARRNRFASKLAGSGGANAALEAFVEDIGAYVSFNLRRAARLRQMSAEFEKTRAGLQHATHLYEGEGKVLGSVLMAIVRKHHVAATSTGLAPVLGPFIERCEKIEQAYANRIIGF